MAGGPILKRSTFGGTFTETMPHPGTGLAVEPMGAMDLQGAAIRANGWSPGLDRLLALVIG